MASVRVERLWGFVNQEGKDVISPKYYEVVPFKCGLARVISRIGYFYTHDFIEKTGREVIPCIFNGSGNDASEGYVFVNDGIKTYMIDSLGNKHAEFDYHRIYPFEQGYVKMGYNSKYGLIDKNGKTIIEPIYDNIQMTEGEVLMVQYDRLWGCLDLSGKKIIPIKYEELTECKDGLAYVKLNGKWEYVHKNGNEYFVN